MGMLRSDPIEDSLDSIRQILTGGIPDDIMGSIKYIVGLTGEVLLIDKDKLPVVGVYNTWYNQNFIRKAATVCRWLGEVSRYDTNHVIHQVFRELMYLKLSEVDESNLQLKRPEAACSTKEIYKLILQQIENVTYDFSVADALITANNELQSNDKVTLNSVINRYIQIISSLPMNIRVSFTDTYQKLMFIKNEQIELKSSDIITTDVTPVVIELTECFDPHNDLFSLADQIKEKVDKLHDIVYHFYRNK